MVVLLPKLVPPERLQLLMEIEIFVSRFFLYGHLLIFLRIGHIILHCEIKSGAGCTIRKSMGELENEFDPPIPTP